ncbi:MAG TPA: shikimate dehydrogenase [Elusimicrobiota bacterium]|nr:shikimate dehydrogenase [Elusimicrobiota bacterium]
MGKLDLRKIFENVSEDTRKLGVVGYPLGHTFSPAMHTAAIKALGLRAEYKAIPVEPDQWDDFLRQARELPLFGFNVTVPYKEKAASLCGSKLDRVAIFLGAANTVLNTNEGWRGFNTDAEGFSRDLEELEISVDGKNVVLLGAGGASRAVYGSFYERREKPKSIFVYDCDVAKATGMLKSFKKATGGWEGQEIDTTLPAFPLPMTQISNAEELRERIGQSHLLINATPVGLKPGESPVPTEWLHGGLTVYDLIYHHETELVREARKKGGRAFGGLGMLVRQGARSFEIWFDQKPDVDVMMKTVENELKERNAQ